VIPLETEKIAIQDLLANVGDELEVLSIRMKAVEALIFDDGRHPGNAAMLQKMQDMDLIIQQVSDLGRAVKCVSDVALDGAMLQTSALGDKMHLNDLRQRLLGFSDELMVEAPRASEEILMF